MASSVIRGKIDSDSLDCTLQTMGTPMTVSVGASSSQSPDRLGADEIATLQNDAHLSDRQVLVILRHLRNKLGRKCADPHIRELMIRRKQLFADLFSVRKEVFTHGKSEKETAFVVCNGKEM